MKTNKVGVMFLTKRDRVVMEFMKCGLLGLQLI